MGKAEGSDTQTLTKGRIVGVLKTLHQELPEENYTVVSFLHGPVRMFPVASDPNRPSSCRLLFRPMALRRLTVACCRGRVFLGKACCSASTKRVFLSFSVVFSIPLYVSGSCGNCKLNGSGFSQQLVVGEWSTELYMCHWQVWTPWEGKRRLWQDVTLSCILCAWLGVIGSCMLWQEVCRCKLGQGASCWSRCGLGQGSWMSRCELLETRREPSSGWCVARGLSRWELCTLPSILVEVKWER